MAATSRTTFRSKVTVDDVKSIEAEARKVRGLYAFVINGPEQRTDRRVVVFVEATDRGLDKIDAILNRLAREIDARKES